MSLLYPASRGPGTPIPFLPFSSFVPAAGQAAGAVPEIRFSPRWIEEEKIEQRPPLFSIVDPLRSAAGGNDAPARRDRARFLAVRTAHRHQDKTARKEFGGGL